MSLHDHWWLYNDPDVPAAIQWSDDNLLAVAARGTITILNPGALDGPRSFATVGAFKLDTLQVGALPRQPETSGTLLHAVATEARTQDVANSDASVLCMAWSPLGSTQQGGCILATVGSDHVVSMHGRLGRAVVHPSGLCAAFPAATGIRIVPSALPGLCNMPGASTCKRSSCGRGGRRAVVSSIVNAGQNSLQHHLSPNPDTWAAKFSIQNLCRSLCLCRSSSSPPRAQG